MVSFRPKQRTRPFLNFVGVPMILLYISKRCISPG
jgi:hypothetical protein